MRKSQEGEVIVFIVNATPMVRHNYRLGVPHAGFYRELINTDAETYGGGNVGNLAACRAKNIAGRNAITPFSFNCRRSRRLPLNSNDKSVSVPACRFRERRFPKRRQAPEAAVP